MAATKRQCSTCEHYGAPRGKRLHHSRGYRCRWKMPPVEWPSSVTGRSIPNVVPHYMAPGDGKTCPAWQAMIAAALADARAGGEA